MMFVTLCIIWDSGVVEVQQAVTKVQIAHVHFVSGKAYAIRASPGGVIMR